MIGLGRRPKAPQRRAAADVPATGKRGNRKTGKEKKPQHATEPR